MITVLEASIIEMDTCIFLSKLWRWFLQQLHQIAFPFSCSAAPARSESRHGFLRAFLANVSCICFVSLFFKKPQSFEVEKVETSLRLDSTRRDMCIYVKEQFVLPETQACFKFTGLLNLPDGSVLAEAAFRRSWFPKCITRLDIGFKIFNKPAELVYVVSGKKTLDLTEDGLLSVDLKSKLSYGIGTQEAKVKTSLEISRKIFNFNDGQDLKMMIGYDLVQRRAYVQLRENKWTFNADLRGNWMILYDL